MHRSWFIWENGKVDGPLSLDAIEEGIGQKKWPDSALIWFRGQKDWVTLGSWAPHLPTIKERLAKEKGLAWYCKVAGQTLGPLALDDLARMLKVHPESKTARLWSPSLKTWTPIYQIAEFGERLNFHMRLFARAPITGDVEIHSAECTYHGRVDSVSERGMHISTAFKHDDPNQAFHLTVKSLSLPKELKVTGRAIYRTAVGFGLRFGHLSQEDRSVLQDYILQYQESPELRPRAGAGGLKTELADGNTSSWFISSEDKLTGPFAISKTVEILRNKVNLSSTLIRAVEDGNWISPYEDESIAMGLGVERRKTVRVPVVGLLCLTGQQETLTFETLTLSEQGISVINAPDLSLGQTFDAVLKIPTLGQPLRVRVGVRYKSPEGDVGLSFESLLPPDLEKIALLVQQQAS